MQTTSWTNVRVLTVGVLSLLAYAGCGSDDGARPFGVTASSLGGSGGGAAIDGGGLTRGNAGGTGVSTVISGTGGALSGSGGINDGGDGGPTGGFSGVGGGVQARGGGTGSSVAGGGAGGTVAIGGNAGRGSGGASVVGAAGRSGAGGKAAAATGGHAGTGGTSGTGGASGATGMGGASSACRQTPVPLGVAGDFVVLAGSTVTNTGLTLVTGDLGVSPGTAVTGFPPGVLVGVQHAGDPVAAQAEASLTTAYNDAARRILCPIAITGNLGGQTLLPGLYKSTSSLEISSGNLTLDARGDPSAVWIFQIATTLTTTSGRQVILSGSAESTNVFWQVGTSATLGSTSTLQGTIIADQSITLTSGATVNGRVMARLAAVTLDSNVIVKPAP